MLHAPLLLLALLPLELDPLALTPRLCLHRCPCRLCCASCLVHLLLGTSLGLEPLALGLDTLTLGRPLALLLLRHLRRFQLDPPLLFRLRLLGEALLFLLDLLLLSATARLRGIRRPLLRFSLGLLARRCRVALSSLRHLLRARSPLLLLCLLLLRLRRLVPRARRLLLALLVRPPRRTSRTALIILVLRYEVNVWRVGLLPAPLQTLELFHIDCPLQTLVLFLRRRRLQDDVSQAHIDCP